MRYVHLGATILSAILEYRIICSFEKTGVKVEMCKLRPDSLRILEHLQKSGELCFVALSVKFSTGALAKTTQSGASQASARMDVEEADATTQSEDLGGAAVSQCSSQQIGTGSWNFQLETAPTARQQRFSDAMAIVRKFGKPDLFITFGASAALLRHDGNCAEVGQA